MRSGNVGDGAKTNLLPDAWKRMPIPNSILKENVGDGANFSMLSDAKSTLPVSSSILERENEV